jgi:hypothetical protein
MKDRALLRQGSPEREQRGKNTQRTTVYTGGKRMANIVKSDEPSFEEEEEKKKLGTRKYSESVNYLKHTDVFGAKSGASKIEKKEEEEDGERSLTPPHTGKKTNWPGMYCLL